MLSSPAAGSWIEYETTDFMNERSRLDPAKGEVEQANPVALYLNRSTGGRDQRIFVAGDSDFLATAELTNDRAGLNGNNFRMITEVFRNFSYGEYPVVTGRVRPPDDELHLDESGLRWAKMAFIWISPSILLAISAILWLRRRNK